MFLFVSKLYFLPSIYIFFLFYFYNYVMFNKPARVLVPIYNNCNFSGQNGQSCREICKRNNFHLFTINGHKF